MVFLANTIALLYFQFYDFSHQWWIPVIESGYLIWCKAWKNIKQGIS